MANEYLPLIEIREKQVDGIGPWTWIIGNDGSWDGPKEDWENSHKVKFLEHVKNFNVCVQAGGNLGMYPLLLSKHFQRVYTFEPDPLNFYVLSQNCQDDKIVKMQAALGDRHKMIELSRFGIQNTGMFRIRADGDGLYIPQLIIDDLDLPACGFIQLDVEFYEKNVLDGAIKTIDKFKPVISVENGKSHEIQTFMKDHGYSEASTSVNDIVYIFTS